MTYKEPTFPVSARISTDVLRVIDVVALVTGTSRAQVVAAAMDDLVVRTDTVTLAAEVQVIGEAAEPLDMSHDFGLRALELAAGLRRINDKKQQIA